MVTITIDEATLNATRAALDERAERLERSVAYWQFYLDRGATLTDDLSRALVWNIAALHETRTAQELYSEVEIAKEYPADVSYHDFQAVGPR
jgi:hypothetical protein